MNRPLTRREEEVLRLLATGAKTDDIARQMFLSPSTVKAHLTSIYAKMGVANRTAAALAAFRVLGE